MLLRSKIRDLSTIIFWLLSVGKVVDGSVNGLQNNMIEPEMTSQSERTTSAQETFKKSVKDTEDQGGGGTTFDDFDEDEDDDHHHLIHHRRTTRELRHNSHRIAQSSRQQHHTNSFLVSHSDIGGASKNHFLTTEEPDQDFDHTTTMSYNDQRRHDYSDSGGSDYEGRLKDSFFNYVKRRKDYDQNEVPWKDSKEGVEPVQVQMSAYLRNVLNVDEPAQLITVETSLRMTWTDPRLNVTLPGNSPTDYIRFGPGVVRHLWFPDVYIDGIQDLRSPAYKVPAAYVRVYNTSKVKYSARVNYDVACPMHFEEYPMDTQRCNISFESWGHPCQYIVLNWLREKRKFSSAISLAQFDLDVNFIEEPLSNFSILGSYSRVTMQLVLTRKITYHLFRTYLPSGLFVIIGWFSLFIPLDHVPGRVTMGMTTLLTLAAMFSAIATTTPRVSYSSKLDVWMVFCVIFVFGTLLEFTLLIFLQKQVFATKLQRSLTAISMVRSQAAGRGSINSGSGSGLGNSGSQGMTGAAMLGGMAGLMGTSSVGSGIHGMATTQTTPRHEPMENDSSVNGGNERIQLTAMSDKKGGKIQMAAQALGGQNRHRGRCRANTFDFIGSGGSNLPGGRGSNHVSLQPMMQPLQPSAAAQIATGVRREMSHDTIDDSEFPGGGPDPEYERLLAEEERQREILFTIERYGIVVFAIFFIFFNIFYWLHLLHSQIF